MVGLEVERGGRMGRERDRGKDGQDLAVGSIWRVIENMSRVVSRLLTCMTG